MNKNRSYSIECGDGHVLILDKTEINSEVENTFISHFSNFFNLFSLDQKPISCPLLLKHRERATYAISFKCEDNIFFAIGNNPTNSLLGTIVINNGKEEVSNTAIKINPPEGFELVSGNLTWKDSDGCVTVKAVKTGNWTITARATHSYPRGGHSWGDVGHVYIGVRENTAWIRETEWPAPVNNWYDYTQPLSEGPQSPKNNQQIESELLFSTTPELNKEITITYRVTPSINISSAQMQMWLFVPPKGFELVDIQFPSNGEIFRGSWIGGIKNGQTVEINATYRITSTGWGNVEGQLLVQRGGEVTDTIVDLKLADLSVDEEGGKITPRELKPYEAPKRREAVPNYGEICNSSADCIKGFCLKCPIDTQVVIQTDPDPGYVILANEKPTYVTKSPHDSYCANFHAKCVGNIDGDEYVIHPRPRQNTKTEKGKKLVELDESVIKELTKEGLIKWKSLVLNNISESYFKDHIDIIDIKPQIKGDILVMGIRYQFKFDWAAVEGTDRRFSTDREVIYIKQLSDGEWVWLDDEEITRRFNWFREGSHSRVYSDGSVGHTKPTEYEIESIISKEEALSKLKQCHRNMKIDKISVGSKNNAIQLIATGRVNLGKCETCNDTYMGVKGSVDLITGNTTCISHEYPCFIYSTPSKKLMKSNKTKGGDRK